MNAEPRLAAFLEALPHANPQAFCSPPGLGGVWRVRFISQGLERGVLKVHWSGKGLTYAAFPTNHGACENCAAKRAICTHCACATCAFDHAAEERGGGPVPRVKVDALMARLRNFEVGNKTEALDAI